MEWAWGAVVGLLSAVVPVISIEAYLVAVANSVHGTAAIVHAIAAATGQTVGKAILYWLSVRATTLPWFRRKISSDKWQRSYDLWRARIEAHPWSTSLLVLVSAFISIPPLYLLTVIAGQLRFRLSSFLAMVFMGRLTRFLIMLSSLDYLFN